MNNNESIGEVLSEMRSSDSKVRGWADRIESAIKNSTDIDVVFDWYIDSVPGNHTPVWTGEHIEELFEDFYLIPRTKEGELE